MRFDLQPFSLDDVKRAGTVPISPRIYATAQFEGVKAACVFREFYLKALIQGLMSHTDREEALLNLHYRMIPLLVSLLRVGSPLYFQSVAAAARAIFELGMDLALVAKDSTNEAAERLAAFTRVERYSSAEQLVEFYRGKPDPPDFSLAEVRALCADAKATAEIDALLLRFWQLTPGKAGKRRFPTHWSKHSNAKARAIHLGWEERYIRTYKRLSWHIHGGTVGIDGLRQELFDILAADSYGLAVDVVLDAYAVLGRELKLSRTAGWDDRLTFLGRVTGLALVDDRLISIGESPRFGYLEDPEAEWLKGITT